MSEARKYYRLPNNKETYIACGDMLESGIRSISSIWEPDIRRRREF